MTMHAAMNNEIYPALQQLLHQLELEMIRVELWESIPPSAEALASQQPFCIDTLSFPQWLQFILLPRMQALTDARLPLPAKVSITPMATESLKEKGARVAELISLIAKFDELLSGQQPEEH